MSLSNSFIKNTIWELSYYFFVVILGFLAPRFIILIYGSEVNGLSSTITQVLNILLLLQAGATTASTFSLYKPIANNDYQEIARKKAAADCFFKKIAIYFSFLMLITSLVSSFIINSNISQVNIFLAFILMGLKSFLDLYFVSKYRIIYSAFQKRFVISIATLLEQTVYYILVFISLYFKLHFLFLYFSFFIGCTIKVVFLNINYNRTFGKIIPKIKKSKNTELIPNRMYSLANEIAHSVVSSSIAILMAFMYGLYETSVYSIYALVASALNLISIAIYSSFEPSFGNLLASSDDDNANRVFTIFRFYFFVFNSVMLLCMLYMIIPFVEIYTSGIKDATYSNSLLAALIALNSILSIYRVPYNTVVSSAGFFKETWLQPVITSVLSISLSLLLGSIRFEYILIGPICFYAINFTYQHFKLKKLIPYLYSNNVLKCFIITLFGYLLVLKASLYIDRPLGIVQFILLAIVCLLVITLYFIVILFLLDRKEFKLSITYLINKVLKLKKINM